MKLDGLGVGEVLGDTGGGENKSKYNVVKKNEK